MRECEVSTAGVGDQLLSDISVQIESFVEGVNYMVILVDSEGVLPGEGSRSSCT